MPTNLYGRNDNFHLENSHVLPALLRRFHEAKVNKLVNVVVWGSGSLLREFLHVDDLADAVVFLLENYSELEYVNVWSGKEVRIKELAELVNELWGLKGSWFGIRVSRMGHRGSLWIIRRLLDLVGHQRFRSEVVLLIPTKCGEIWKAIVQAYGTLFSFLYFIIMVSAQLASTSSTSVTPGILDAEHAQKMPNALGVDYLTSNDTVPC
ncbi:putative GDP-L-fucose synthase 2 [Capsicum baccatum]|uniref:GDP-L-fucose synthase 2 n=1 Tax=Capsicum baccatum TaxID=33114 RepID=A0A2G2WAH7_CAPBA|nr:putative GDP-L-fucose synthase 2 [Capsicum baccatum]